MIKRSLEARERMRQAQLQRDHTKDLRGEKHPHIGKPAISKRDDVRAKLSAMWTEEKKKEHSKRVTETQTGVPKKLNIEKIVNIYNETGSVCAIGRKYGMSHETVSKIKNHETYTDITSNMSVIR